MKKIIITLTVLLFGGLFSDMIPQDKKVKDTSDFIRELVDKIKNEREIDEARYPALIKEVEMRAMTSANPEETAILYSLLAEMYSSFEQRNSWKFAQRTPLSGYVPDDINEWTATIFQEKIMGAFRLSLQPAERLQQIPIGKYAAILQTGKDETLRPTLYDYLLYRVLEFNPTDDLYQALIAYKKKAHNPEALLLASLDYLKFTYSTDHLRNERSAYFASLDSLYQAYALYDFAAEVWIERIQCMESDSMEGDGNQIVTVYPEIADLCRQAIDRYPLYKRIGFFKNKLMQIQNPELQVSMPSVVYPRQEIVLNLNYKNLKSIHIKIYETDRKPETLNAEEWGLSRNSKKESIHRRLIRQVRSLLTVPPLYQSADTTIRISGLEGNGIYECEFLAPDTDLKSSQLVYVTNLMAVSRSGLKNGSDILVTNMCSGKPVGRAMVLLYGHKSNKRVLMDSLFTDENGLVKVPAKENIRYYRVVNKADIYMPFSSLYPGKAAWRIDSGKTTTVALFTDRGLYRPGQSVFVKGLVYASEKENRQVVSGKTVKVILRDANHKEITRQTFTTNEFGSFNGEFLLPKYGLNGSFSLSAENTTQSFRVEEYKRPSFFLEMDSVRGEIAFGDTVRLSGKAQTFSGSALQKGTAGYRVILRPFRLFSDRFGFSESQVANGEAILDENGSFAFNFVPEKPAYTVGRTGYSSYEVIVTLTDSRGETQEIRSSFSVGTNSIVLSTDLSENEKKETCSVRITALTLNGEMVSVQGRFMLYPLTKSEERPNSEAVLIPGDVVRQGNFSTETTLTKTVFASLPSGRYRLRLEALDGKGRMIEGEQDFVLYSEKDKRPPVFSDIWLLEREFFASPQEDVEFVLGTSYKKAYVLYELVADGKLVSCKRLELSNENRKITIPFLASYGDGAVASFTFVKEGKLHTRQVRIYKKLPNKKLILKTETFRDRLAPGSRETWRFKVMSPDSLPAIAEILASMYDASLDAIAPFDWYFSPEYRPYLAAPVFGNNPAYFSRNSFASGTVNYLDVPEFEYSRFDWQNALLASPVYMTKRSYASASMKGNLAATEDVAATGPADVMEEVAVGAGDIKKESGGEETASSLRRNFQETAFFFPVLRTDKGGNWMVNFTLPESNTTWKFQALAHTTDLKYGQLTQKVVSNKSLMVLPYIPRFVRNGDEIDLRAQIMNRSEQELKGRIRLELFDPETEENVVCLTKAQIPFSLDAGRQTTVNWRVLVPAGYELVGVRVLAETEMGSDGEQHLLPVLPNEMLITESTPFYLPGEKEKEIEFPAVPEEAIRTYRQVFELSANPVWYAVQALSTLLRPENSSASSWFAAYYSNTLASFIVRSNSRMRTIIEQWAVKGGDAASLLSRLEQNEELKNVVLEETPWVLEAETETEQIARLNVLFDLNRAESQRAEALQELTRLQREDGAWGWFDGFAADRHITTSILQGMADLANLNAVEYGREEKEMQMRALLYLDGKIGEDYVWLKKQSRDVREVLPSELQLAYLLMRSSYRDIPETQETREAIRFYTGQAGRYWEKLPVHMRVQTALLLFRKGEKEKARAIMNWFVRTATRSEEQGVFWANNRRIGFSPVSPVETQVLLMMAFAEMKMKDLNVDKMKQWLLNQKHTQYWETTPATLNAVYALLSTGTDWFLENNRVVAHWGNEVIDTQQGFAGIGYVKNVRMGKKAEENKRVRVRKEGQAPAWGALYRQYFIPGDQVKEQRGELSVDKQFFVEKISEKGRLLVALESGNSLRVGEKVIVRLTLRVRQEMSYVHLKDLRAACFEPVDQLSGMQFREGIAYYRTSKDASEHFYFDRLPEGVFVLEYAVYVSRAGEYTSGPADIQCLYAPEYTSHTEGGRLIIKD